MQTNNHEYHIVDIDGAILLSSLSSKHFEYYKSCCSQSQIIKKCPTDGKRKRHGKLETTYGTIYIISDKKPFINSAKNLKAYQNVYYSILKSTLEKSKSLIEGFNKRTRRLLHNLRSQNAHNIQEIEALIPQNELTDNLFNQVEIVGNKIDKNRDEFSNAILRMMKNNLAMKVEFNVFDKMFENNPKLRMEDYRIDRVIYNVLQTFFVDFQDLGTNVMVGQTNKTIKLDYETFQVCLYHLFENSTKFLLPQKDFAIKFMNEKTDYLISFDMISLKIHDDEMETIFEEGVSGKEALRVGKQGQGIGMYRSKNLLKLNNAIFEIERNGNRYSKEFGGATYENNIIKIRFKNQGSFI